MAFEPKISIVIVNLNGLIHLDECFRSIRQLDYPREKIETILVDNGSTDESVVFVRKRYPWVRLIRNQKNEGFAKPSNDGARAATGDYVAFLNNDMKVQKTWLRELVRTVENSRAVCAGSVILNWDGKLLDFAGGSISFYGMGYQYHFHAPLDTLQPLLQKDRETLFACGGAMLIKRDVFLTVGGFDEDYFAYFEDVDLGWRLHVLGYNVVLSMASRVYHKHHSTASRFASERMQVLYKRNSLYTIFKNYGDAMLQKTLAPILLIDQASLFQSLKVDSEDYDLSVSKEDFTSSQVAMPQRSVAELCAVYDFARNLKTMTAKRNYIQKNRKVSDEEILKYIPNPFLCLGKTEKTYYEYLYDFSKTFKLDEAFHTVLKRKILLISSSRIAKKMTGPAIRYYEFARNLSKSFDVMLASKGECDFSENGFLIFNYLGREDELVRYANQADIILLQGFILQEYPRFSEVAESRYLIIDLYDPFLIENMETLKTHDADERKDNYTYSLKTLRRQMQVGDYFLAANEKQQDYWMGMLSNIGWLAPQNYDVVRDGDRLVGLVPFGLSDEKPIHTRDALKGVWPGIEKDDFVLLWGGGVWNWFDPLTLIRAVKQVVETHPHVKLFFMGVKSPNPDAAEMKMLNDAVALAKELGLYDRYVFFNFGWVDYADRQNYLLEADVGVSSHFHTLETRFSFRTRILDYLWSDLPIICTKGDFFSNLVEEKHLGLTVDYQNEREFADCIIKMADDKALYAACKGNIPQVADCFRWSRVTEPITRFCSAPTHFHDSTQRNEKEDLLSKQFFKESDSFDKTPTRAGRQSVQGRLQVIEKQQADLARLLKTMARREKKNDGRLSDLQTWSYMMNDRFNKIKKLANPVRALRRLFRRK